MAIRGADRAAHTADWNPPTDALWRNRVESVDGTHPTALVLRHPATPYTDLIPNTTEEVLFDLGSRYVALANRRAELDIPPDWLEALNNPANPESAFGWSRIWKPNGSGEAVRGASFWMERGRDHTLVLVAGERWGDKFLNSGFGIRIVAHLQRSAKKNTHAIRITGLVASLPFAGYRLSQEESSQRTSVSNAIYSRLEESREQLAGSLRMSADSLVFSGIRAGKLDGNQIAIDLHGVGNDAVAQSHQSVPHWFSARGTLSLNAPFRLSPVSRSPMVADMGARVFPIDPASQDTPGTMRFRRPTRDDQILNARRSPTGPPTKGNFSLEVGGELAVYASLFVRSDKANVGNVRRVNLDRGAPSVRSNDFSAVSAYWHFLLMLGRMKLYGFSLSSYFRMAQLPLKIFYRSGIRPGPGKDGQTVNARVLPDGWPGDFYRPPRAGSASFLQLHLALANRSTRVRRRRSTARPTEAEPLGIASDARWMWHEFGHVLLMASVGELEFRFAHSAGDALAAIASDPLSRLADPPKPSEGAHRWRGATFPWVFVPRRHDRCVSHGWSWCGSMHRPLAVLANADNIRRKGYRSEQILSSSLFRLYLCLGGDTNDANGQPDREARGSASHYALYLIIKAIGLLGDAGKVPTALADGFVSALIDADVGTETFNILPSIPPPRTRVGGCAFKPTRWAFEAQGLYASDLASISNRPGLPEPVDIFIEDQRPLTEENPAGPIEHRAGGYVPVSLHTHSESAAWHVQDGAIGVRANGVHVVVKNRGQNAAANVTVRLWWANWPQGTRLPDWNDNNWTQSTNAVPANSVPTIENRPAGVTFGPFTGFPNNPGVRYVLLAEASCPGDRAISDPATLLPCSRRPTALVDLVGGDNNIGLLVKPVI